MEFLDHILSPLRGEGRTGPHLLVFGLAAVRIYAILRTLPPTGGKVVPLSLRIALSIVLAIVMAPGIEVAVMPGAGMTAFLVFKEAVAGFVIGFVASLPFHFLQQSGYLVDASRGGAMSQLLSPAGDDVATPHAGLFFFLCAAVFFGTPAGTAFWMALETTFHALPLYPAAALLPAPDRMIDVVVATTAGLFLSSVMLAFPVMLLVFLVDALVGILGRFSPMTGSYFISMPLRSAAGISGAVLVLIFISPVIERMLMGAVDSINRLFGV
ncbi:MAG: flagellar biosynthetic protein FliR [Pseudomonadota bacterium]